jgi:HTH-like domain
VLGVSPAGYYAWRGRPESLRKTANRALLTEIRQVHMAHRGRYGAPRIYAALRARGYMVSRGRVCLMRHQGIRAITPRRFRVCTTDSNHDLPIATNRSTKNSPPSGPIRFGSPTSHTCPAARKLIWFAHGMSYLSWPSHHDPLDPRACRAHWGWSYRHPKAWIVGRIPTADELVLGGRRRERIELLRCSKRLESMQCCKLLATTQRLLRSGRSRPNQMQ